MSITECVTVMQEDGKRGDSSRKQTRLPVIAPKDDQASSTSSRGSGRIPPPAVPPRARLPPRSRTGCWTCRTRKVKCDEGRPLCGQCARLGHACDYHPRLSFRDDTARVVERMQDVTTAGSAVWDRQSSQLIAANRRNANVATGVASPAPSSAGSLIDDLPPFGTLLTDEDREKKAEAAIPGTFNVIVNPESFQHLAEYSADENDSRRNGASPLRRASIAASLASSIGRESLMEAIPISGDPNTVILPRFEDLSRRSTREVRSPTSPAINSRPAIKREESESNISTRSPEIETLRYFRDRVWRQLIPPEHGQDSSIILLDEAAGSFPPLIRAMIAVGSLAMFQQEGRELLDSLQQYSQTLPALKSALKCEEDLASDGAFLTHFLMLVYEIATSDMQHSNIWQHHISTLLRITVQRQCILGAERFPFIVWWICNMDLDALLSGMGSGEFVGHMLKNDLIPPPSFHLYPLGLDGLSVVYPEERKTLSTILTLDYEIVLHAVRLGLLAYEFRNDNSFDTADVRQKAMAIRMRQSRVFEVQEGLRHLWAVPAIQALGQIQLPIRCQRLFQHAWTLFQASIIYSHTSMWPGQAMDTSPDFGMEIATASQQILHVAQQTIPAYLYSSRFLTFPLFMAGVASTAGNQKMLAADLISKIEGEAIGRNIKATKQALETVYERQNRHFMHTGHSLDVDWLQVMLEQGLAVVNFGL